MIPHYHPKYHSITPQVLRFTQTLSFGGWGRSIWGMIGCLVQSTEVKWGWSPFSVCIWSSSAEGFIFLSLPLQIPFVSLRLNQGLLRASQHSHTCGIVSSIVTDKGASSCGSGRHDSLCSFMLNIWGTVVHTIVSVMFFLVFLKAWTTRGVVHQAHRLLF